MIKFKRYSSSTNVGDTNPMVREYVAALRGVDKNSAEGCARFGDLEVWIAFEGQGRSRRNLAVGPSREAVEQIVNALQGAERAQAVERAQTSERA